MIFRIAQRTLSSYSQRRAIFCIVNPTGSQRIASLAATTRDFTDRYQTAFEEILCAIKTQANTQVKLSQPTRC
jgi:hypothetical protein